MTAKRPPAPRTRIQNYGGGHGYFLEGDKVPGVTTIIGNGLPKPALLDWSAKMTAQFVVNRLTLVDGHVLADDVVRDAYAWNDIRTRPERHNGPLDRLALEKILKDMRYADLDAASGKGTRVHTIATAQAHGEPVEIPDEIASHVETYQRFLDEWDPTDMVVESVVINRQWRYMGRFDLSAQFGDLGRGLIDIKTGRSGVFAETALQLEAYDHCETMIVGYDDDNVAIEEPAPEHDWIGAVHIRADGYDVYRFERRPDTFRVFLYCQQIAEWLDRDSGSAASIRSHSLTPPRPRLEVVK
jgi:hypothetical protein